MNARAVAAERLGRLPARVQRKLSRQEPIIMDGQRLEADVQLMLALREVLGQPVWDEKLDVETARRFTRQEAAVARGTLALPVAAVDALRVAELPSSNRRHAGEDQTDTWLGP